MVGDRIEVVGLARLFHGMFGGENRAFTGEVLHVWTSKDDVIPEEYGSENLLFIKGSVFYRDDNTGEVLWVDPNSFVVIE